MKILVTGGNGFIGSYLIKELVKKYPKSKIGIVDDLSSSELTREKTKFYKDNKIKFYRQKVENFSFQGRHYDQIYHLASPVGPVGVLKYAGLMGKVIINDAVKMANLAIKCNARLLSVSTSEVYGPARVKKSGQKESSNKIVPSEITVRLEYGTGKLLSEVSLLNLAKVTKLKVNFVRPFNIIGPHQNGSLGFVVPRFVESALANKPLTIFGTGEQLRCFTHVQDIVEAMILLMDSTLTNKIFNIGNPKNVSSIRNLAEKIIELSGSKSKLKFIDPRTIYGPLYAEAWNKIPDISLIKSEMNWRPRYQLIDLLNEYIDFAKHKNN